MQQFLITGLFLSILPSGSLGMEYQACIDDSDCVDLGHKYACFMYMCYPWKEPDSEEHPTCTSDWDCWLNTGKCFRHHRVRQISKGVCFRQIHSCFKHEDCPEGHRCCGKHCCPLPYFEAWKEFSCYSDVGCQSLKLGPKCCSETNRCCGGENEDEFFSTLSPTILESVDYPLSSSSLSSTIEDEDYVDNDEGEEYPPILPEEHQLSSTAQPSSYSSSFEKVDDDYENESSALCDDLAPVSSSSILEFTSIPFTILCTTQLSTIFLNMLFK